MRPPSQRLAPRDRNHQAAPPRPSGGGARGPGADCGERPLLPTPPPSPPPRPPGGRRPTGETAAPHPPERAAAPRGGTQQPRRAQPRAKCPHSLPHSPLPTGGSAPAPWAATERRHPRMRRRSGPPWCPPGEGGGLDRGKETPPPPPPTTLTHRRPTRPRPAPTAARHLRLNVYTKGGCAGEEGGQGRGPQAIPPGQGGGEQWRGPPSPLPLIPPPGLRATGAPALHPPEAEERFRLSPEGTAKPGERRSWTRAPRAPAPPTARKMSLISAL